MPRAPFLRAPFLRTLAASLRRYADISEVPTERAAAAHILKAVHHNRCPCCQGPRVRLVDDRRIYCRDCARVRSLTATTPLRGTRISLRRWLAALWHVHVDSETLSARAFSRRYDLREMTAWALLHRARDALPLVATQDVGAVDQVLGRRSPDNVAFVSLVDHGGILLAERVKPAEVPLDRPPPSPHTAMWLMRLRMWIADIYRGVQVRWLDNYLSEFIWRIGRPDGLPILERLHRHGLLGPRRPV